MQKENVEQRTQDFTAGFMEALHEVEPAMLQAARERDIAYERGYEEGRGGGAFVPFVFLGVGTLIGFALCALLT